MSGDRTAVAPLVAMARAGEAEGRSQLLQVKAIESLGRLRDGEAIHVLRELLEAKKMWKWVHHREVRIAAAQALAKIDPRYGSQILSDSGLEHANWQSLPLDSAPACPWVRQRRYERIVLAKTLLGHHQQFLGQIQHSDPRNEPGRRHGHQRRQSAHWL